MDNAADHRPSEIDLCNDSISAVTLEGTRSNTTPSGGPGAAGKVLEDISVAIDSEPADDDSDLIVIGVVFIFSS
jgi:hypothetical protein